MTSSPMKASAITNNGVSMFNLDLKEYRRLKSIEETNRLFATLKHYITLWSPLAVISISTALLTPIHFA